MADESMISLFGADNSDFLDELTGPGPPPQPLPSQQQQGLPTMLSAGQDQEYMPMDGMQQLQQHSMPQATIQQQAQQQGSYPQMNNMPDQSYGAMNSNMSAQYSAGGESFGQFGTQKLHHLDESMLSAGGQGSQQQMSSHSPQRQAPAPQQFGSPASGMIQQRPTVRFPTYSSTQAKMQPRNMGMQSSMPVGQRMPILHQQQPQQQHAVEMAQTNMWNQQQQQTANQSQNYLQQQPSPQQSMPGGGMQQMRPQYLTHHEYGLPNDTPQIAPRLSHYPTSSVPQQQNTPYVQNMNQMQQMVRMPMSSPTTPTNPMNPFVSGSQVMNSDSNNINTSSYNDGKQQATVIQQKAFGNEFTQQGSKMTPTTGSQTGKLQHYQYPSQQMSSAQSTLGMSDTQMLTHYPNCSPTQTTQYKTPYPTAPQQQRIPTSPRPTPPPTRNASEQLGHMPSQSANNVQQTSLQQLEQLVSPQMGGSPTGQNPYRQVVQTVTESSPNASLSSMPSPTGSNHSFSGTAASYLSNNQTILSTCSTPSPGALSGNVPNCPMSPNRGGKRPSPQNITVDIQQSQQQLQQLYSMAQTPQIQQRVLEVQERIRQLKAQQMIQIQQQSSQSSQPQMQSPPLQTGANMQQPSAAQPHPTMPAQHVVKQQTSSQAAGSPTTNTLQKVQIITIKVGANRPYL